MELPDSFTPLSDPSYLALTSFVEAHVGIKLPAAKKTMVEGRLRRRVRALRLPDLNAYAAHALDPKTAEGELVHLIDCITTNKTDFFREPAHFAFLRDVAVPALVRGSSARRPAEIKIWSAACSTGAEAYTAAMVLQDLALARQDFRYAILGTDVSSEVLMEARAAIYPRAMLDPVPSDVRERYVMVPKDASRDAVRIVPELRRMARFERLNLMDEIYPFDRDVDVIFCRNVLIYFDRPTQKRVVDRLVSHLRPGGYLLLGHSESMAGNGAAGIRQIRPTVFQADPTVPRRSSACP